MIKLQSALVNYNWSILTCEQDVNRLYSDFVKVVVWFIDACIPSKRVLISTRAPSFVTPLIKQLLRRRNKLCEVDRTFTTG